MRLFIKKIIIFFLVFVVLVVLQLTIFKSILIGNTDFKLSESTNILILGDSHIEANLNDSIIENSINFSYGGSPLFFNYIKLKKIVENNEQINTLILGFSPNNLVGRGFYEVPKMKSMLVNYHYLMNFSDYYDIAKYNFRGLIAGTTGISRSISNINFIEKTNIKRIGIGGFRKLPIDKPEFLKNDIIDNTLKMGNPDPISIKYFFKIVNYCKENDIKLIILNTPVHASLVKKSTRRRKHYDKFIKNIDKKVIFWDYEDLHFDNKYFYDENHLNYQGAALFSSILENRLKINDTIK